MSVIDLDGEGVVVDGPFRVGVELRQDGPPSVLIDDDGVTPGRSFIEDGVGWAEAGAAGISGDWIIRATIVEPPTSAVPVLSRWGITALVFSMTGVAVALQRGRAARRLR